MHVGVGWGLDVSVDGFIALSLRHSVRTYGYLHTHIYIHT